MMVIIVGVDEAQFLTIQEKDQHKHFLRHRGQLYKMYPNSFTRMVERRFTDEGQEDGATDSVLIYQENNLHPHHPGNVCYDPTRLVAEVHAAKVMKPGASNKSLYASEAVNWLDKIIPYVPIILVGIVLVYALVSG